MTPDDLTLIEVAACLLDGYALDIRMAHNVAPQSPDWRDEPDAKAMHDQTKGTSDALCAMADRIRAEVPA
jgi:hypothetical protein